LRNLNSDWLEYGELEWGKSTERDRK
jgi:hypothetical protein